MLYQSLAPQNFSSLFVGSSGWIHSVCFPQKTYIVSAEIPEKVWQEGDCSQVGLTRKVRCTSEHSKGRCLIFISLFFLFLLVSYRCGHPCHTWKLRRCSQEHAGKWHGPSREDWGCMEWLIPLKYCCSPYACPRPGQSSIPGPIPLCRHQQETLLSFVIPVKMLEFNIQAAEPDKNAAGVSLLDGNILKRENGKK